MTVTNPSAAAVRTWAHLCSSTPITSTPCNRDGPAVSIHAYSPPLREMTFFSRDDKGVLQLDLSKIVQGDEVQDFTPGAIIKGRISSISGDDFVVEHNANRRGFTGRRKVGGAHRKTIDVGAVERRHVDRGHDVFRQSEA